MNREENIRVRQIVTHPLYQQEFSALQKAEQERIYCNHTMEHFLDVARICYIMVLQDRAEISRELIYGAALLHDLGRYRQIAEGIPHEEASACLAEQILTDCGFAAEERSLIKEAILQHRGHGAAKPAEAPAAGDPKNTAKGSLGDYLYRADKMSRLCFCCDAAESCKWSEEEKNMKIGNRNFDTDNHCYIMGILNVTPDSFSDGGRFDQLDAALSHAGQMIEEGADVIDVGGESTRPGHQQITDEKEIARVVPVIEAVKKNYDVPVSIDTYKSSVAEAALQAGADLVNDIWGFKYDPKMAEVTARHDAACCLMHNRKEAVYGDFLQDVISDMKECLELADDAGVAPGKILLDPGVGFAKSLEQNLQITKHVDLLKALGCPVLLGTSRKSMIGLSLDLPVDQRVEGTLATTVVGVMKGCGFVRVHDIRENKRVIQMTEAILKSDNVDR